MPRKQNPIQHVLDYFETAPIDAAKLALDVVSAVVKRRSPKPTAEKKPGKKAGRALPPPTPATVGD